MAVSRDVELKALREALVRAQEAAKALETNLNLATRDAERYRYIRDNHEVRGLAMEIVYGLNGSDWDRAIDAAISIANSEIR